MMQNGAVFHLQVSILYINGYFTLTHFWGNFTPDNFLIQCLDNIHIYQTQPLDIYQ